MLYGNRDKDPEHILRTQGAGYEAPPRVLDYTQPLAFGVMLPDLYGIYCLMQAKVPGIEEKIDILRQDFTLKTPKPGEDSYFKTTGKSRGHHMGKLLSP